MPRYKIGYTTGVFDMFHIGHLNLGDRAATAREEELHCADGTSSTTLAPKLKNEIEHC